MRLQTAQRHSIAWGQITLMITLIWWIGGCAQMEPPPGGPEDKRGPFLIGSVPANGATSVVQDNKITLWFSEPIKRPKKQRPVFISPRPEQEPELKWKKDRLEIILTDSFATDRTYIVSAGAAITDLRNNQVDSGLTIAFSCGTSIDSGEIAGTVLDATGMTAQSGFNVVLFESDWEEGYDSLYGEYVTQTNAEGHFSFEYLPPREYRLVAYRDVDRDDRFGTANEPFAVPDRVANPGLGLSLTDLAMTVVDQDTALPSIITASVNQDGLVKVRFARSVPFQQYGEDLSQCRLISLAADSEPNPAQGFQELLETAGSSMTLWFGTIDTGQYRVEIAHEDTILEFEPVVFTAGEDQMAPEIIAVQPDEDAIVTTAEARFTVVFSEPLDRALITNQTFVMIETLEEDTVGTSLAWLNPMVVEIAPEPVIPGGEYRLELTEFELADGSGTPLGDSLQSHNMKVLSPDDLGTISGMVEMRVPYVQGMPIVLSLHGIDNHHQRSEVLSEGEFAIDVPAGRYLLHGYLDRDGNGRRFPGSVWPYQLAESLDRFADTIVVKARFETSGIDFAID